MRRLNFKLLASLMLVAFLSGCGGLGKMVKNYPTVKYEVEPKVLETHADKVSITVKGTIPPKYFHKKALVEFVPVLKYDGGELALKPVILQGEKVKEAKGTVVNNATGGKFTFTEVVDFVDGMKKAELVASAKATLKKTEELGKTKLADGVIYTSKRIGKDEELVMANHNYDGTEKIMTEKASLFFPYSLANINMNLPHNKDNANKEAIKKLFEKYISVKKEGLQIKNFAINAWASPEGETRYNEDLSEKRAKSGNKFFMDELKKVINNYAKQNKKRNTDPEIKALLDDIAKYELKETALGEDWEGFMKAINASDIKDKNVIINIVNSQQDVEKREQEIRNMAVIYKEIEVGILPSLRRAEFTMNIVEPKKTKEEMIELAKTNPTVLDLEELHYAVSFIDDNATKLSVFKSISTQFPQDWRAFNNIAYLLLQDGNIEEASSFLDKANTLSSNNGMVLNNLGVVAAWKKDYKNAKLYYEQAQQAKQNVSYNMGVLSIISGDYKSAISNMSSKTCKYNLGLAQLLSGDAKTASGTFDCVAKKEALTYYLMAVCGARLNDVTMLITNLKKAIQQDVSLRNQAAEDREFLNFFENADFKGLVN